MDLKNTKPSSNFEDRTSWGERDKGLNRMALAINPVHAYRKVRDDLLRTGVIDPPKRTIQLGLPKRGGQ